MNINLSFNGHDIYVQGRLRRAELMQHAQEERMLRSRRRRPSLRLAMLLAGDAGLAALALLALLSLL